MSPLAANQAGFFSATFQRSLCSMGRWTKEKEIEGQKIDAYGEFEARGGVSVSAEDLIDWLPHSGAPQRQWPAVFAKTYGAYVERRIFGYEGLPTMLRPKATCHPEAQRLRVGVEFETGNIASSFRALLKLNLLFRLGQIDVGIFITSSSKAGAAAAIWPPSNRNGSFEELELRRWREIVEFPVLAVGFEPDRFDTSAPVLRTSGQHALVVKLGSTRTVGNKTYDSWQCPGEPVTWHTIKDD